MARSHKDHTPPFGESLWLRAFVRVNSMHDPCHHVAVAAADLPLRARSEDEEAFAAGVRLDLLDLRQIDDRRAVDVLEIPRAEPLFQILHSLAQDQAVFDGKYAHIVA